jgi:hypothetical protein
MFETSWCSNSACGPGFGGNTRALLPVMPKDQRSWLGERAPADQAGGQIWRNYDELEVLIANIGFGLFGGQTGHPDPIEARNFDRCFGINHVQPDACDTTVAHSQHVCGF